MGVERWRVHVVTDQDMKHDGSMLLLIVSVGDREDVGVHPEIVNVLAPVSSVAYSLHNWRASKKKIECLKVCLRGAEDRGWPLAGRHSG